MIRSRSKETSGTVAAAAVPLRSKGLEEIRSEIAPEASLYHMYNHLTFAPAKSLGPRRKLEKIADSLLPNALQVPQKVL
ncbi:hypothetical protein [Alicyclobacillus fastidiosus]|uniref:Uncharacterized protein n=1 Tax=Alicyclobacillus fastidiosus TaxID=392011 RepID=A0ABV5ALC2_9BACL|nr:hypothetical protein [Alicyclobacillus fastidiosus]WEH08228.1 hypothetical protein PYS47_16175 [Alicyclobacillus fastidiosus]